MKCLGIARGVRQRPQKAAGAQANRAESTDTYRPATLGAYHAIDRWRTDYGSLPPNQCPGICHRTNSVCMAPDRAADHGTVLARFSVGTLRPVRSNATKGFERMPILIADHCFQILTDGCTRKPMHGQSEPGKCFDGSPFNFTSEPQRTPSHCPRRPSNDQADARAARAGGRNGWDS